MLSFVIARSAFLLTRAAGRVAVAGFVLSAGALVAKVLNRALNGPAVPCPECGGDLVPTNAEGSRAECDQCRLHFYDSDRVGPSSAEAAAGKNLQTVGPASQECLEERQAAAALAPQAMAEMRELMTAAREAREAEQAQVAEASTVAEPAEASAAASSPAPADNDK